jgi:hypothetical protein
MAYDGKQVTLGTLSAATDLSTHQYKFVKLISATTVGLCTAATDRPIGVLQNKPASGEAAEVCIFGITKLLAGGTIVFNNVIGTDASSTADKKIPGTDTSEFMCGTAITAAASGEYFTALLQLTNARGA